MNKLIVGAVALGLGVTAARFTQKRAENPNPTTRTTANAGKDPCEGKAKCVIFYTTPWCPVCTQTLPSALKLANKYNNPESKHDIGLRVLVGADKPAKVEALANEIGSFASPDANDSFAQEKRINSFPTWFVLDKSGKELHRISAGIPSAEMADAFAKSALNL